MEIQDYFRSIFGSDFLKTTIDTLVKLGIAAVLGGLIGFEREHSHRPAGFRTHILVSVGSALVMLTSTFIFAYYKGQTNMDPARLGAQVISGIGFLGAGTILREGFSVKGLTTAASLWAVSCIGLAVGVGYISGALIATAFIYLTLNILKKINIKSKRDCVIDIEVKELASYAMSIGDVVTDCGALLRSLEIANPVASEDRRIKSDSVLLKAMVYSENVHIFELIAENIRKIDGVIDAFVE